MIHQPIQQAFPGDEPAQQAVAEMAGPVARYAEMTRRLAIGVPDRVRPSLLHDAKELRGLIICRATSAGIVDHQMETFWQAAQAEASARYRRKVEIYPLPGPAKSAEARAFDPVERDLELQIIDLEERWKRAGERLAQKRTKLAAHRAAKVSA